jgi:rod shape-determining protein MreD
MGTFILPVFGGIGGLPRAYQRPRRRVIHTHVSRENADRQGADEPGRHILTCADSHTEPLSRGRAISYVSPLLAVILGIVHAAIAPVIVIGGVKPNLVLVGVVLVTALAGFLPGVTWAFVAGLTANLLVGDPLGSVPLAMLVVAALATGGARLLGRMVWIYPVLAAAAGSVVADLLTLSVRQLVADVPVGPVPFDIVIGAAALNAAVTGVILLPARAVAGRYAPDEVAAW